ncbi:MAG: ABC transporter ATP-binding protein [Acidimicrobiaceae bacterium]|nr:ABC transporter ATP-binding protein [Acidimicrobiaceae bacterium]
MSSTLALEVSQLRVVRQHNEILKSLSFDVAAGELVGLLGPSGSGKSTLMRSLLGVQAITSGSAVILGENAGSPALRRRIGYMAQGSAIYTDLSVSENLAYFAGVLGVDRSRVHHVLEVVNLRALAARLVSSLSGGERSRVSLAVAMLGAPPLLILDEPTVGLDPVLRQDLWNTFTQLASNGTAVLVSSHVMDEAARCARLLLLREGHLLFDDTPAQLLSRTGAGDYDDAFVRLIKGAP